MSFGEEAASSERVGGVGGNGYDDPAIRQDYTGYQKDSESELEYSAARYYNSQHGTTRSTDDIQVSTR